MYHYVAMSYLHNVPSTQRFGMTTWDVTDNDSWIVTSLHDVDYPTMFDGSYNKKPAFLPVPCGIGRKIRLVLEPGRQLSIRSVAENNKWN